MSKLAKRMLICLLFFLACSQTYAAAYRLGIQELTQTHIPPMEKFLLESEISNILISELDCETISPEIIQKRIRALNLTDCQDEACIKLLMQELNLDFLLQGEISKDVKNNYTLSLKLRQKKNNASFGLEASSATFSELKKTLPILTIFVRKIVNPAGEKQIEPPIIKSKMETDLKPPEITVISKQLNETTLEIHKLEAKIKEMQQNINQLQESDPELKKIFSERELSDKDHEKK